MFKLLIYVIFILCVAFAAGAVFLSSRLRNRYRHNIFSTLLYFQVFIFTFGFYGIWGQALIKSFLSPYISPELLLKFSDVAMLLGLPFLIFAWLMLILFSLGISGRKTNNWLIFWFLLINFSLVTIIGYIIAKSGEVRSASVIKIYFVSINFLYTTLASLLILFPRRGSSVIHSYDRKIIGPALFLIMVVQGIPLLFYTRQEYLAIIFIFTFFAGNAFLPIYLTYGTLLTAFRIEPAGGLSFTDFCKRFEVSPRETDIVREICNGLSNKEISEKLFISLQTVKDHTHRIYIKTNVKSRVQLIYLVKEYRIL